MVAPAARRFWNVPNTLTVSRLVLAVGVFVLIDYESYFAALALFVIAAVTDALDGYFARLLKQDTPIGRQLDPLIDKVIVAGCYIYLATIPGTGVKPWMVTAIVVRELLIQGLRSLLEGQGQAVRGPDGGQAQDGRPVPVDLGRAALSGPRAAPPPSALALGSRRPHLAGRRAHALQRLVVHLDRIAQAARRGMTLLRSIALSTSLL